MVVTVGLQDTRGGGYVTMENLPEGGVEALQEYTDNYQFRHVVLHISVLCKTLTVKRFYLILYKTIGFKQANVWQ